MRWVALLAATACAPTAAHRDAAPPSPDAPSPPSDASPPPPDAPPPDAGAADASSPDASSPDASSPDASSPDAGPPVVLPLSGAAGTEIVHDYMGVIAGPLDSYFGPASGVASCDDSAAAAALQAEGVTAIRNNDFNDGTMDLDLVLDCQGTAYATCSDGYFPCWSGTDCQYGAGGTSETMSYADCGSLLYTAGQDSVARYDSIVTNGFEPFLRLGSGSHIDVDLVPPPYLHHAGPRNDVEAANWITAAGCLVDALDADSTALGLANVRYLGILTEYSPNFWATMPDSTDPYSGIGPYAAFVSKAVQELRAHLGPGRYKIGGGGFTGSPGTPARELDALVAYDRLGASCVAAPRPDILVFLEKLWSDGVALDWFGAHIFSDDLADHDAYLSAVQDALAGKGDCMSVATTWGRAGVAHSPGVELIVDAYEPDQYRSASVVDAYDNHARGGALTAASFILMHIHGVTRAFAYRATAPDEGVIDVCTTPYTVKPRAGAIYLWSLLHASGLRVATHLAPLGGTPLYAIEAGDGSRVDLLVVNSGSTALSYAPQFASGPPAILSFPTRTYREVSDSDDGHTPHPLAANRVSIGAFAVQLLELTR